MKLSEVSAYVRKGINLLILFIILYYVVTAVVIPFATDNLASLFPSKDAPTVSYGMLDPLEFVKKPLANSTPVYQLNTKNGKLPSLTNKMKVYKYTPWRFSYADGTNAQKHAALLGFTDADLVTDLKGEEYSWRNSVTQAGLTIAIHSKELNKTTPFAGRYGQFLMGEFSETYAIDAAQKLFIVLNRFEDGFYKVGTSAVAFGRITGTGVVQTLNPLEAHLTRVDLFKKIEEVPVFGPDPKVGLLQVYLGASPFEEGSKPLILYPKVDAYYWQTEATSEATYPLVPLSQAWAAVSKGNGIIASVVPKDANTFIEYSPVSVSKILVNNIFLAYYETPKFQNFMQPIYVF
jgi:hypothetical protein